MVTNNDWIETNDLIKLHTTKSFFLIGRVDNIINTAGLKIDPIEVKSLILNALENSNIEIEIIGITDQEFGERVALVFQINGNNQLTKPEFWELLYQNLKRNTDSKILPKAVFALTVIPKTETLKVNKMELKRILTGLVPIWEK